MPLDLGRIAGADRGERARIPADHVDPAEHAPAEVGHRRIDAGVEQRDRDAAAVQTGNVDPGPMPGCGPEIGAREHTRGDRRRIRDPHRIDPGDVRVALEQRDGAGVDDGREAVEDAGEAVVGVQRDPLPRKAGDETPLGRERGRRPPALLLRGGRAARGATRCASDGVFRTTITRAPSATRGREPTSPRQVAAAGAETGACPALLPPAASSAAVAIAVRSARITARRGSARGVRIEAKITRVRDRCREARSRGDHRRVVGAERERRERSLRQRGAKLGVRGDTADDGDPRLAGLLDGLADAPDERTDDRALVRGGEIRAARRQLGLARAPASRTAAPS